jgi:hypothetical protein
MLTNRPKATGSDACGRYIVGITAPAPLVGFWRWLYQQLVVTR